MTGGTAHLKLYSLEKGESAKVRKTVAGLNDKGVKKMILDLRNVAGGELSEAVEVANLFVRTGKLATVVGREQKIEKSFAASPDKYIYDGELVALIDLGTAGTGEVIASALIANKRAEVVGENTFGAGVDQALFTLSGGDGFLLTKAKWASPDGTPFLAAERENRGVKPTVEVKRPETPEPLEVEELIDGQEDETPDPAIENEKPAPKRSEDVQLKKAFELLNGKAAKAAGN